MIVSVIVSFLFVDLLCMYLDFFIQKFNSSLITNSSLMLYIVYLRAVVQPRNSCQRTCIRLYRLRIKTVFQLLPVGVVVSAVSFCAVEK